MESEIVTISLTMPKEVALQFAQFAKRSVFDTFYQYTEAHLPHDERKNRAYQMIAGIEAVQGALRENGFFPS